MPTLGNVGNRSVVKWSSFRPSSWESRSRINWFVGLLLLLAAPLIPLNMAMFGMGADGISRRQARQVAELDELVLDRIKGAATLRMLSSVEPERRRIRDAADELANRTLSVLRVALLSSAALEALVTYAIAVAATYIGLVLLGYVHVGWAPTHLDLAQGIFLLLLSPIYFQPFRELAAAYHDRKDVTSAAETLRAALGLLGQNGKTGELRGLEPAGSAHPMRGVVRGRHSPSATPTGWSTSFAMSTGSCHPEQSRASRAHRGRANQPCSGWRPVGSFPQAEPWNAVRLRWHG